MKKLIRLGATTLSKMALERMTLSITIYNFTLSITILSIWSHGKMTLNITINNFTLSITMLSIWSLDKMTLSTITLIVYTQHNNINSLHSA